MDKIAFLDRDGVINKSAPLHCYVTKWDDFVLLDGVVEAIKLLNDNDFKVIIISNQRCIGLGLCTFGDVCNLHDRLNSELSKHGAHIDDFFICPHLEEDDCDCRKPKIGLFLKAEEKYKVDKKVSFMVGDAQSDILAGNKYGVASYLVDENNSLLDIVRGILCKY